MTVYGIKNCNTVKSALEWLRKNKIDIDFHDYKTKGVTENKLRNWSGQVGWESLVNKKGLTWRQLDDKTKAAVITESSAIRLMQEKTSVIKRPLIEKDGKIITLGFDEHEYARLLL